MNNYIKKLGRVAKTEHNFLVDIYLVFSFICIPVVRGAILVETGVW